MEYIGWDSWGDMEMRYRQGDSIGRQHKEQK